MALARRVWAALRLVAAVLGACFVVAFLPSTAWSATTTPTPDPSPSSTAPPPAEPTPSVTETVTVTADPSPAPGAPGENLGVWVDPATGAVRLNESMGVALGVMVWVAGVGLGLSTAWLVLP